MRVADKGETPERPYHHGRLRAALIEQAARLAAERGVDAVTLREVARRAGVSHAAPYHHFPDKESMLAAVAEEGFRRMDRHMAAALRRAPPNPFERLRRMGLAYIRFAVSHPHYYGVMFKPGLRRADDHADLNTASGRAFQKLIDAVQACRVASGDVKSDPMVWALTAWVITHGISSLWIEGALANGPVADWGIDRLAEAVTQAVAPVFLQTAAGRTPPPPSKRPRRSPPRRPRKPRG